MADDLPAIDLRSGRSYHHIENSELTILRGREMATGGRTSDSVQERIIRVIYINDEEFTLHSGRNIGSINVSEDGKTINFLSFQASYEGKSGILEKVHEVGSVLGFDSKRFEESMRSDDFAKRRGWTAWNDSSLPFWAVEVGQYALSDVYSLRITFAWDEEVLKKLSYRAYILRDRYREMR